MRRSHPVALLVPWLVPLRTLMASAWPLAGGMRRVHAPRGGRGPVHAAGGRRVSKAAAAVVAGRSAAASGASALELSPGPLGPRQIRLRRGRAHAPVDVGHAWTAPMEEILVRIIASREDFVSSGDTHNVGLVRGSIAGKVLLIVPLTVATAPRTVAVVVGRVPLSVLRPVRDDWYHSHWTHEPLRRGALNVHVPRLRCWGALHVPHRWRAAILRLGVARVICLVVWRSSVDEHPTRSAEVCCSNCMLMTWYPTFLIRLPSSDLGMIALRMWNECAHGSLVAHRRVAALRLHAERCS